MSKLLVVILFIGVFLLQGYYPDTADSAEPKVTQREKEEEILAKMQGDFFNYSVEFDEDSKTFFIVSDFHSRAVDIAKRGEGLEMRNGQVISWEDYLNHSIEGYFNGDGNGSPFSYGITSNLGKGYTVKEITSCGKTVFIAKDGELIYDIINGYAS